jgi:hypothetical protein
MRWGRIVGVASEPKTKADKSTREFFLCPQARFPPRPNPVSMPDLETPSNSQAQFLRKKKY